MAITERVMARLVSGLKVCSRCNVEQPLMAFAKNAISGDGRAAWCKSCVRNRQRERGYRPKATPEAIARYRRSDKFKAARRASERRRLQDPVEYFKHQVRGLTRAAVQAGLLVVAPCYCGSWQVQAHHEDYRKPLDVQWLCAVHHRAVHNHTSCKEGQ